MSEKQEINLILLHIGIGSLLAFHTPLSKIYSVLIFLTGFYIVVKNKNKNNEILYVIAYIAGSEVFLRATSGIWIHELGKYSMLFFTFLGFFYNGFPKIKNPYWIYLLLLLPSILISLMYLNGNLMIKINFEILGPICMGALALNTYKRKISEAQVKNILTCIAFPILACCIYLILKYSQNVNNVYYSMSNYYFSGNYAPNQMATVFGLGVFIYLLKILTESDSKKILYLNIIIFGLLFFRGLLTISRGGIATGIIVILTLFLSIYISKKKYYNLKRKIGFSILMLGSIFLFANFHTNNVLYERYTNFEILNSDTKIKTRGRYIQIKSDFENFIENPLLGVGVGKGKEIRRHDYNKAVSTHTEITRLLSEHGVLGLMTLCILFYFPLQLYFKDLQNIYLLPFFIFWLFSINHSATRTIAPLFLYTLTLLYIKTEKEEKTKVFI